MDNPKKLLKVEQIADLLQVPKSWIYDRTRQGQAGIPHIRLGAYARFDAEEVINFFKKNGSKSIISHRTTETVSNAKCSYHISSNAEVWPFDALSSHTTGGQADQGRASSYQQKNLRLAHKRAVPKEISPHKKEARTPQKESLNNTAEFGIITSSQGGLPNGDF
ncbi:MAG TPA: helix-turn-helix domain-containing protein [Candidatus Omnitrophota bacterium]|nr:helix-turn-helix domain-containing protein [Candidatus Omnitrophota bacterium]